MPGRGRRVLVVEDEALMRRLLQSELESLNFVVQTASSVLEAKRLIPSFDPDVALIDIDLKGGLNGLHLGHILAESHPGIAQVFLTKHEEARWGVTDGLKFPAGAGFLSKLSIGATEELIDEINRVVSGGDSSESQDLSPDQVLENLGPKGQKVLELLSEGYTNSYIANALGVSPKAIEYYTDAIYRALDVTKSADRNARVEAAIRYQRAMFAREINSDSTS